MHQVALQLGAQFLVELVQVQPATTGHLHGHDRTALLAGWWRVIEVDAGGGHQPVTRERIVMLEFFGNQVRDTFMLAAGHGGELRLELRIRARQRDRFDLQRDKSVGGSLRHLKSQLQGRQVQCWRLDALGGDIHTQQVEGESLGQHLMVFRPTANQGADHPGSVRILQGHVDIRATDTALQRSAVELQPHHGLVLGVHRDELRALGSIQQMRNADLAAAEFLLVEPFDGFTEGSHGSRITAHRQFDPEIVLLRMLRVAVDVLALRRLLKQIQVMNKQPKGAVGITLASDHSDQSGAIGPGSLKHGLFAARMAKLHAHMQSGHDLVPHAAIRAGLNRLDQPVGGGRVIRPVKVWRELHALLVEVGA